MVHQGKWFGWNLYLTATVQDSQAQISHVTSTAGFWGILNQVHSHLGLLLVGLSSPFCCRAAAATASAAGFLSLLSVHFLSPLFFIVSAATSDVSSLSKSELLLPYMHFLQDTG